jgi:hypothetical protein
MIYSDCVIGVALNGGYVFSMHSNDNFALNHDWGIFKAKVDNADACYLYNKHTLCIVYCFIKGDNLLGYLTPYIHRKEILELEDICWDEYSGIYSFKFYRLRPTTDSLRVSYNISTSTLVVEYTSSNRDYPSFIKTFKNSIPKLDNQSRIKLALSGVCAFTELNTK